MGSGHQEQAIRVLLTGAQVRDFGRPPPIGRLLIHILCDTELSVFGIRRRKVMLKWLLRASCGVLKWALCAVGVAALLPTAMIATPLENPPELHSVSAARKNVDYSTIPAIDRFQARDGTMLGFRHYLANGPATGRAAIVIHGSSCSTQKTLHALSAAFAARGLATSAIDILGRRPSTTRGGTCHAADFGKHAGRGVFPPAGAQLCNARLSIRPCRRDQAAHDHLGLCR